MAMKKVEDKVRRNRDSMDDVKVKIPKLLGIYDPEAYLDWEMKVDQNFNCNNFSEEKKIQLASLEFEDMHWCGGIKSKWIEKD